MSFGMLAVLFFLTVQDQPELMDKLTYPEDVHGQFCGKAGTAVKSRPNALFPILDKDLSRHFGASVTSFSYDKLLTFYPTTLCVQAPL